MPPTSTLPLLIVFGLENTLLPYLLETDVNPPFSKTSAGLVIDSKGKTISYYKEVPKVFEILRKKGIQIAVSSVTSQPEAAEKLIELFGWNEYIKYKEIYPHYKTNQIERIQEKSGITYSNMLLFDDDYGTLCDVLRDLGIPGMVVNNGVSVEQIEEGLRQFQGNKGWFTKPAYAPRSPRVQYTRPYFQQRNV